MALRITIDVPDTIVQAFEENGRAPEAWSATAVTEGLRVAVREGARQRGEHTYAFTYVHPATGARSLVMRGTALDIARHVVKLTGADDSEGTIAREMAADLQGGHTLRVQDYEASRDR